MCACQTAVTARCGVVWCGVVRCWCACVQLSVPAALAMAGHELHGQALNVQPAKKHAQKVYVSQAVVRAEAPKRLVPAALYERNVCPRLA